MRKEILNGERVPYEASLPKLKKMLDSGAMKDFMLACEVLSESCPVPVKRVGVNDAFGTSGKAFEVADKYGISAKNIYENAKALVK